MDGEIKKGGFKLLPPAPGKCPVCADNKHGDDVPHNRDSLFYCMWFNATYGRSPTWADAALLCSSETRALWRGYLIDAGVSALVIGDL